MKLSSIYMKKASLAAAALLVAVVVASPASAVSFTLSDKDGSGSFGVITGTFTDATQTTAIMHVDMNPNFIVNTGQGHSPLTISLGTGFISAVSQTEAGLGVDAGPFTILPKIVPGTGTPQQYRNGDFGFFSDAVGGTCGAPGAGGCGSDLWFTISNFAGFLPATELFNGTTQIFAAVDIFNVSTSKTFAVGVSLPPTPTVFAVPGPLAGAGLPTLLALGGFMWARRRKAAAA
jgi:hypothetical protein